jgi:hypothetical protein
MGIRVKGIEETLLEIYTTIAMARASLLSYPRPQKIIAAVPKITY